MSINNDGGRAFPRVLPDCKVAPMRALEVIEEHAGMSLRDYFAAAALTGLIATPLPPPDCSPVTHWRLAEDADRCADAMLKARKQ